MKVLLLLALFSVCNANAPSEINLDRAKDAFWDYVGKVTLATEDSLTHIRESKLGQGINNLISESSDRVKQYVSSLRVELRALVQVFREQFAQEVEHLKARLRNDLKAVSTGLQPIIAEVFSQFQKKVNEIKIEIAYNSETMNDEEMKAFLLKKGQELKAQLAKSSSDLRGGMGPYSAEIKKKMEKNLEEFRHGVGSIIKRFQGHLAMKRQEIRQRVIKRVEELKARLAACTQRMRANLAVLWESFIQESQ